MYETTEIEFDARDAFRSQQATSVKTRKTAEKRAAEYIALFDGTAAIGEVFEATYWNGREVVAIWLRYDVVPTLDGFDVWSYTWLRPTI